MLKTLKILFFGDLVGKPGCRMFQKWALKLKEKYKADGIVVNAENSADNGRGITKKIAEMLLEAGACAITTGNHVWGQKETAGFIDNFNGLLLRPANFPSSCPGKGYVIVDINGINVAIVNLQGRVFMHEQLDCPFRTAESLITFLKSQTNIILVDFHAETSSEKQGIAFFLDGKVSAVLGTHTHVQTADERILTGGTAFITDLGCAGALNSMLGMQKETILKKLITQMPSQFVVELKGPMRMTGVLVEIDVQTGKAIMIERFSVIDSEVQYAL